MSIPKHMEVKNPFCRLCVMAAALLCVLLVVPSAAWAHKVNVFAYVEGDIVVTESYFSGSPASILRSRPGVIAQLGEANFV